MNEDQIIETMFVYEKVKFPPAYVGKGFGIRMGSAHQPRKVTKSEIIRKRLYLNNPNK